MAGFFHQDFLFENIRLDKYENPDIELQYGVITDKCINYSFSKLLETSKQSEWEKMLENAAKSKSVAITDDMPLENEEMKQYKLFYLKTYMYVFGEVCEKCFIVSK